MAPVRAWTSFMVTLSEALSAAGILRCASISRLQKTKKQTRYTGSGHQNHEAAIHKAHDLFPDPAVVCFPANRSADGELAIPGHACPMPRERDHLLWISHYTPPASHPLNGLSFKGSESAQAVSARHKDTRPSGT